MTNMRYVSLSLSVSLSISLSLSFSLSLSCLLFGQVMSAQEGSTAPPWDVGEVGDLCDIRAPYSSKKLPQPYNDTDIH